MRSKLRMRFYCDHCKKSGSLRQAIERHERGCTNNPNRVCGICAAAGLIQKPITELCDAFIDGGYKALRAVCEACPACTLTVLRLTHRHASQDPEDGDFDDWPSHEEFNFKSEMQEWFQAQQDR